MNFLFISQASEGELVRKTEFDIKKAVIEADSGKLEPNFNFVLGEFKKASFLRELELKQPDENLPDGVPDVVKRSNWKAISVGTAPIIGMIMAVGAMIYVFTNYFK